jgi:PKD domain
MDSSSLVSSLRRRSGVIAAVAFVVSCATGLALSSATRAVDPPPGVAADFKWNPAVPVVGQTVIFESTSTVVGPGNTIVDHRWDLDGDTSNGFEVDTGTTPTVNASYQDRGEYGVRLRVEDADGNRSTIRKTVRVAGQAPIASYTFAPTAPLAGQPVTFTSTAIDPDGSLAEQVWDLDGDGVYDNGAGPTALRAFANPGVYVVGLRATDNEGAVSFYSQTVIVDALPFVPGPTPKPGLQLLSPFPVVRIAGRLSRYGVRLKLLSIDAPLGSNVVVRCKGRSCPFKKQTPRGSSVRVSKLERSLRAGVTVRIFVTSKTAIGKYVVFKIRRGATPLRTDACLMPGSYKPVSCSRALGGS